MKHTRLKSLGLATLLATTTIARAEELGTKFAVGCFDKPIEMPRALFGTGWNEWSDLLQNVVVESLSGKNFQVVERDKMRAIQQEQGLVGWDVDPSRATQIGKMFGANYILVGRVKINKEDPAFQYNPKWVVTLTARVVSVETSSVAKTVTGVGKVGKSFLEDDDDVMRYEKAMARAADDLATKLAQEIKPVAGGAPTPEKSIEEPAMSDTSGTILVESEGRAKSSFGMEVARSLAVRNAVEKIATSFCTPSRRTEISDIVSESARYARAEGAPISENDSGSFVTSKVQVRVFLTRAPSKGAALISALRDKGVFNSPKVMVLVAETHIQRPRIPDPAVETAIIKELLRCGFNVVDAKHSDAIRYEDWVVAMEDGQINPANLRRLKNQYGADIVVTGEAFSMRAEADRGGRGSVRCAARGEIKAFWTETAQMIMADSVPQAQAQAAGEEIAAKMALENAGNELGPKVVDALLEKCWSRTTISTPNGPVATSSTSLKVSGMDAAKMAGFIGALKKASGVTAVRSPRLEAGVFTATIELSADPEEWCLSFPSCSAAKNYGIQIHNLTPGQLEGKMVKVAPQVVGKKVGGKGGKGR